MIDRVIHWDNVSASTKRPGELNRKRPLPEPPRPTRRRIRRLTDSSGIPVALTKGEYSLLIAFLDAPQRPLSREHLLQATRMHEDVFDRSIDVQVLRLRRKLETDPNTPRVILTERGVGYVFALPVEAL